MYCPHCGTMLEEEGFFCPFCGESLQEEQTPDMTQNFQEPFRPLPKAQWMIGRSRTCDFVIPAIGSPDSIVCSPGCRTASLS